MSHSKLRRVSFYAQRNIGAKKNLESTIFDKNMSKNVGQKMFGTTNIVGPKSNLGPKII